MFVLLDVAEQIEDLTARLQGPQGPPGAGYPGAPGEPGPQGSGGNKLINKANTQANTSFIVALLY